jgi:glutamyl-tRNA synthetase
VLQEESFRKVTFLHHEILLEKDGKKMSKSAGATSVCQLRKEGKRPAAIYTTIAQMLGIAVPVTNWQTLAAAIEAEGIRKEMLV